MRRRLLRFIVAIITFGSSLYVINILGPIIFDGTEWFDAVVGWANIAAALLAVQIYLLQVRRSAASPDAVVARTAGQLTLLRDALRYSEGARLSAATAVRNAEGVFRVGMTFQRRLAQFSSDGGAATGDFSGIGDYYRTLQNGRIVIVGGSGAGKSVLALGLVVQLLHRTDDDRIPLRMPILSHSGSTSIESWMIAHVSSTTGIEVSDAQLLVRSGKFIPVVDGLDELDSDSPNFQRAARLVEQVNNYVYGGNPAPIIITCRTVMYDALRVRALYTTEVEIDPVEPSEALQYIQSNCIDANEELGWLSVCASLSGYYGTAVRAQISQVLSTPWMLTLAITAHLDGTSPHQTFFASPAWAPTPAPRAPGEVRQALLRAFIPAVVKMAQNQGGRVYPELRVKTWMRYLAYHLRRERYLGRIGDLRMDTWWRTRSFLSRLTHVILNVLLTLSSLTLTYAGLASPNSFTIERIATYLRPPFDLDLAFIASILIALATAIGLLVISVVRALSPAPAAYRLHLLGSASPGYIQLILAFVLAGAASGALIGSLTGRASGLSIGAEGGLVVGLVAGTMAGLLVGGAVVAGRSRADSDPGDVLIRNDLLYGLVQGLSIGALMLVGGATVVTPAFGMCLGLASTLYCGFVLRATVAIRYYITVGLLRIGPQAYPLQFLSFVRWALDVGLLRSVGSTYQIRHDELQRGFERGEL